MAKKTAKWLDNLVKDAAETQENLAAVCDATGCDITARLNDGDTVLIETAIKRALALTRTLKKLYAN